MTEPIRAAVAVVVAIVGLLQVIGVIDVNTAGNIIGFISLVTSGEVARAKVRPIARRGY